MKNEAMAALFVVLLACGGSRPGFEGGNESVSPSAKTGTVDMLLEDRNMVRHPADGGGFARLTGEAGPFVAGRTGRFTIVYEAGPLGIEVGGALYLLPSPFWGWSSPQLDAEEAPGFTRVSTQAVGVELAPAAFDGQMLVVSITGRALAAGETVRVEFGAGEVGARVDRYAERDSKLWIAVDGDGDGIRKTLASSPDVEVVAGPPTTLVISLPSVVRPREKVRATLAWVDKIANAGAAFVGDVELKFETEIEGFPRVLTFGREDEGRATVEFEAPDGGAFRMHAHVGSSLVGRSNPMVVSLSGARVYWGDLHGHSALSDGSGTPEDYFRYARDTAGLDVAALTDHDHWGILFLDETPSMWREIKAATEEFNDPGRFVTVLGYEWTSWLHGHRHVLYFDGEGEVLSSVDPEYDTPAELWSALAGRDALTVAHHSAGGPIATNWNYAPDPVLEPLTEVVSVHGSSEAIDAPGLIYSAVAGNFVRDALDRGYRFGFLGSGDSHDGHPGLAHLGAGAGGLAGIVAADLTREGILKALRARRVYATNGARILLRFAADGQPMGSVVKGGRDHVDVFVKATGTAPIRSVDLIRSGAVIASAPGEGHSEVMLSLLLERIEPGEYLYARVVQEDGGAAWSSPVFFEDGS